MIGHGSSFGKWFWRFDRLLIVMLALPVVGLFALFIREGVKESAALERARAMPEAERRAIVEHCVKLSAGLKDYDDLRFDEELGRNPEAKPIPPEFAALQPMRVTVGKTHALFILQIFHDSGVSIHCTGLDTPTPSAKLSWGEIEGSETWVEPKVR